MNPPRNDLAVIGGGPAGLAAAVTAAENGLHVVLVDENPRLGGQIWRSDMGKIPVPARPWMHRLRKARVEILAGSSIWDIETSGRLLTSSGAVQADQILLACGARERLLPFPGWTIPGVLGAGGIQAMMHSGLEVADRRIVIAGSGPLLLQVASGLARHGARVLRISEQAPLRKLLSFSTHLGAAKLLQAISLAHPRFRASSWPLEARGVGRVEQVRLQVGRRVETIACDYLAVGFGLVPNLELARLLGCEIENGAVVVDARQRTSLDHVLAAGEVCGVKGAPGALADGICAGFEAASRTPPLRISRRRDRERLFEAHFAATFALREEVRKLARSDTIICRCEEVEFADVAKSTDWASAKLHSRCGMGLCQGRICGSATEALLGWGPTGVRPPLTPLPIGTVLSKAGLDAQ